MMTLYLICANERRRAIDAGLRRRSALSSFAGGLLEQDVGRNSFLVVDG